MEVFFLVTNWMPFYTALTCLILVALTGFAKSKVLHLLLLLFLTTIVTNWFVLNLFYYIAVDSIVLMPLLFLGLLLNPILLYHFVSLLTRFDSNERFPKKHYLFAGIIFIVSIILFGLSIHLYNKDLTYLKTLDLMPPIRCIFSFIYCILALQRIKQYRKEILNISSNEKRAMLHWINPIFALYILQVLLPFIAIISGISNDGGNFTNPFLAIIVIMISYQNISLTHNTLIGNFETINIEKYGIGNTYKEDTISSERDERNQLLKQRLEDYFELKKPYLNSDLKIVDIITPLQTNRTYLSTFINETYNMNFCRFINHYRLSEYEQLLSDPKNQKLTKENLAILAGFSNHKAYLRAKNKENISVNL